ncbi:MAG: hypothetical protein Q8O43_00250 [Dehalococcoidia bacterium]|nr:hypothetical protein [Dehalococcoidia bacterium]
MTKKEDRLTDKELEKILRKSFRGIGKIFNEEPHLIFISDGDGDNSNSTISEITAWLFHRRQDNGGERNGNSN